MVHGDLLINDGFINSEVDRAIYFAASGFLDICGGTITNGLSVSNNANSVSNDKIIVEFLGILELRMYGGTIQTSGNNTNTALGITTGILDFYNGTITSKGICILCQSNVENHIRKGTITTVSNQTAIKYTAGTLTIGSKTNIPIITGGVCITQDSAAGILTILGGELNILNGGIGIDSRSKADITIEGGTIHNGNGTDGIKTLGGNIILQETGSYSGAVIDTSHYGIDATSATSDVNVFIGIDTTTFDNNSTKENRRPFLGGMIYAVIGTRAKVYWYNGCVKGGFGSGTYSSPFNVTASNITYRSGYKMTLDGSQGYHYLSPTTNTASLMSLMPMSLGNTMNIQDNEEIIDNIEETENSIASTNNEDSLNIDTEIEANDSLDIINEDPIKVIEKPANKEILKEKQQNYIVQVGENKYTTIAEAIANANNENTNMLEMSENIKIVKLLQDIVVTEEIIIDEGTNIVLDLSGKTLSSEAKNTIINNGTLRIISQGTIKNDLDNSIVISNFGDLYIDEAIIEIKGKESIGIYNNSNLVIGEISTTSEDTKVKIIVSNNSSKGIYNEEKAVKCDIQLCEIIIEKESSEEIITENDISYGIYNNSNINAILEKVIIKAERSKSIDIQNNSKGVIIISDNILNDDDISDSKQEDVSDIEISDDDT